MIRSPVTNQILVEPQTIAAPLIANEAFYRYEAMIRVENSSLTAPPASPHDPGRPFLILSGAPTGAWTGMASRIVFWHGSTWQSIPPVDGMQTYCATTHRKFRYNASAGLWLVLYGAYSMGGFSSGTASLDGSLGAQFELSATGNFSLSTVVNTITPGQTYFALIINVSGSSRTVTFTSGKWIGGGSSIAIPNNQVHVRKFTRSFGSNASVVMYAGNRAL